jgi:hypothetical protein
MNAYTTRGRARIRQSDLAKVLDANPLTAAASLRALEWRRGCEAEAELEWLLKQHGVLPQATASPLSMLRQAIGTALVWAGERLMGAPRDADAPEAGTASGTLGAAS